MTAVNHRPNRLQGGTPTSGNAAISWLLGGGITVLFYAALPFLPVNQADAQRYFCGHWIEYATTGLFFIGMTTLALKARRFPSEGAALRGNLLAGLEPTPQEPAADAALRILDHLETAPANHQRSLWARRISDICHYVVGRRSGDGVEGHLTYLAELASGRLHDSYALIRTITWAVPILGFLGTVIGITMAIANVTPDQLKSSLNEVTGGLAVAFDTTALSLALSMVLVFTTFIVERREQVLLDQIEDVALRDLAILFPVSNATSEPAAGPWLAAQSEAAQLLMQQSEQLVDRQVQTWQRSLDLLRERWSTTLQKQQEHLDSTLQHGVSAALSGYTQQLQLVQSDLLANFQHAATALARQVAATQTALQEQQTSSQRQLAQTWDQYRLELRESVSDWQGQLRDSTFAMRDQLAELRTVGGAIVRLADESGELARLEQAIAQNLESVRVVDSLEQTLLNLNAAVNLLTARTKNKAA